MEVSEIEISKHCIPAPRSSKLRWYKKFWEQKFLLNDSAANILLTRDSLISNISRYQDVWSEYFSKHSTLNVGIPGEKIQNLLWKIENLEFTSNLTWSCIFILCGTNNVDHNSAGEIVRGLISFVIVPKL